MGKFALNIKNKLNMVSGAQRQCSSALIKKLLQI